MEDNFDMLTEHKFLSAISNQPSNEEDVETNDDQIPYFDSSDVGSFTETSDEEDTEQVVRRKSHFAKFDCTLDVSQFSIGMKFTGPTEFRQAVANYAIAEKKDIKFAKNENTRIRAVCKWPGCPWTLFASIDSTSKQFMVKTFNLEHKCLPTFKCERITAKFLTTRYGERILTQPGWKLRDMQSTFRAELEVDISLSKCKRTKLLVTQKFMGSHETQYAQIWDYAAALLRSNLGSTVIIKTDRIEEKLEPHFKRMCICFDACKRGFKTGCRPVIGLDGCFSKGRFKFEILCVIGRDANNQIYPIAWAVVEVENRDVWDWFFELLIEDLELMSGQGYVLITDQQKGLKISIEKYLPLAEHRMCARHIYGNWMKKHKGGELKKLFWKCAKSFTRSEYEENLELVKAESKQAAEDLFFAKSILILGLFCGSLFCKC